MPAAAWPVVGLLLCSNLFMTIAWYGHLRFPGTKLWVVILASWGIALVEYCFAVPANRLGYTHGLTGGQLKILQECVTLFVFALFAMVVLKEPIGLRYLGAAACMAGAVAFLFVGK